MFNHGVKGLATPTKEQSGCCSFMEEDDWRATEQRWKFLNRQKKQQMSIGVYVSCGVCIRTNAINRNDLIWIAHIATTGLGLEPGTHWSLSWSFFQSLLIVRPLCPTETCLWSTPWIHIINERNPRTVTCGTPSIWWEGQHPVNSSSCTVCAVIDPIKRHRTNTQLCLDQTQIHTEPNLKTGTRSQFGSHLISCKAGGTSAIIA